ncbi:MAG: response regulator [Candidatus Omnitrophica bacterium]|nr:response regulator [Candidatus Omnitrophota bacterium]
MKRILIVDDEKEICDVLVELFSPDYETAAAYNGIEALKLVTAQLPDLVVADFKMPLLDGISLIERIVRLPDSEDMKFILISGFLENAILKEWKNSIPGRDVRCFQKPVDMAKMEEAVKKLLYD